MELLQIRSATGQLVDYLKDEIRAGKWTQNMPGESWLMAHLQVGRGTVRAAMAQLEAEGVLVFSGQGKRRKIATGWNSEAPKRIRVRILLYEKEDRSRADCSSLLVQLLEAGMDAEFSENSLKDLGMRADRVSRFVKQNPADAWVVMAAAREVLEWFAGQPTPVIALFGRHTGLPIAAAYAIIVPGLMAAVRRLEDLGHTRIVMITREERRKPVLSYTEQLFLAELEAAGIKTGKYNLPDWEESRGGFRRLFEQLFRLSPPTAMIFQEAQLFIAARTLLADRGVISPRDVSLVVADTDPSFAWYNPTPSHIEWDYRPVVRRIVRWIKNVSQGKEDRAKSGTDSIFIEGGTIGPVPAVR